MKTKDKIIITSIDLFNRDGVVAVTTNHIAKFLGISPGNLYFHFENKEEIIRQIFKMSCRETYSLWKIKKGEKLMHPLELIEKNYELVWKYRFFYRELYYLTQKDEKLAQMWRDHIKKVIILMTIAYKRWHKRGWMSAIEAGSEMTYIVNMLVATATTFLQFFEMADRQPTKEPLHTAQKYVARVMMPYTQNEMIKDFKDYVG